MFDQSTPEAFQRSELVKEIPLKHLDKHSIRTDRPIVHFMFTEKDGSVVRPKVYSDHKVYSSFVLARLRPS